MQLLCLPKIWKGNNLVYRLYLRQNIFRKISNKASRSTFTSVYPSDTTLFIPLNTRCFDQKLIILRCFNTEVLKTRKQMQISLRDLTNDEQNVLQSTVILDSVLRRHRQCIGLSDGNALVYLILYMYIYICIYIYIYMCVCVCVCTAGWLT